jgi:FlaA1/EpsC-like NDP-sugar epimerase
MLNIKKILITGVCGTVGSELVRQLLEHTEYGAAEIIGIDNNESELFFLDQKYLGNSRAIFYLTDIRDSAGLEKVMKHVDIVFHAAALKHVVLCERSPMEAVQTNISGVNNVISAALENSVKKVVFTSSDKAVNPTNVMGTSKLMGERLISAANSNGGNDTPSFISTRFGNVLGSNGSVIPIFHKQIQKGGPVTLTDTRMTRFVMSIEQAARMVIESANIGKGGEVFITKMPVIRIKDLAQVMIQELAPLYGHKPQDIEIKSIGIKPGEKLFEELMSSEEIRRSVELDQYFAVLPAFRGMYRDAAFNYQNIVSTIVTNPYVSSEEQHLTEDELRDFLINNNLLAMNVYEKEHPDQRYWPGDKS